MVPDALYSWTLLIALVASGAGSLFFDYFVVMRLRRRRCNRRFVRLAYYAGSIAVVSMIVSAVVHLVLGHGPTAPEPMTAGVFFLHHKAYWLVAVLVLMSFAGPVVAETGD